MQSRRAVLALLILVATAAAYAPSIGGDFIWDDDQYVTDNPHLRDGAGLVSIWVPEVTPQYYPVTFSVFWVQYQLWGARNAGYDLVNLALHIANALLVWRLFAVLGLRFAWLLGAVFALHPVHVESVAWVTELKNVLSGFFYLLAGIAYLRFDTERERGSGGWPWYAASLAGFLLALLSKSVTASLPAALVLALLYRGGRFDLRRLLPLLPMFVLGAALALQTAEIERAFVGAEGPDFVFTPVERILIGSRALLFYAGKLLFPWPLMMNYPRWQIDVTDTVAYLPVAAVLLIGVLALASFARGRRGPALALAFFAGSALPALGGISFYPMIFSFVADHFIYLPSLGIFALALGVADARLRAPGARALLTAILLLTLFTLTALHSATFHEARTLYRHAHEHNATSWQAPALLGTELVHDAQRAAASGDAEAARRDYEEASRLLAHALANADTQGLHSKDDRYGIHLNLALALSAQGETSAAYDHAARATSELPEIAAAHALSGILLEELGRREEARQSLYRAAALDPGSFAAHLRLGALTHDQPREALQHLRTALAVADSEAERAEAALALGWLLATSVDPGLRNGEEALRLARTNPRPPLRSRRVAAAALAELGRFDEAVRTLRPVLERARAAGRSTVELDRDLESYENGEALRE